MCPQRWVQTDFFKSPVANGQRVQPRLSHVRVNRDPAVALSYAEGRLLAAQVTNGFALAFGRLAPEQRASLRAALEARHALPGSS